MELDNANFDFIRNSINYKCLEFERNLRFFKFLTAFTFSNLFW